MITDHSPGGKLDNIPLRSCGNEFPRPGQIVDAGLTSQTRGILRRRRLCQFNAVLQRQPQMQPGGKPAIKAIAAATGALDCNPERWRVKFRAIPVTVVGPVRPQRQNHR